MVAKEGGRKGGREGGVSMCKFPYSIIIML